MAAKFAKRAYYKTLPYSAYKFENNPHFTPKGEKKALKTIDSSNKNIVQRTFIVPTKDNSTVAVYTYESTIRNRESSSLVFFIHGGGWAACNWNFYHHYCKHLASVLDAVIVSADYRVAPDFKYPIPIQDCYSVLEWVGKATEFWQIDRDRIYLYGESSGANLCIATARLARESRKVSIAGQILVTPITDARLQTESHNRHANTPTITREKLRKYLNNYIHEDKDVFNPDISPLLSNTNFLLPKTFVISAECDPLHDDADLFAKNLLDAKVECLYYEAPEVYHDFIFSKKAPCIKEIEKLMNLFILGTPIERMLQTNHAFLK
ncbi:MAG: alpha/beta hydrolase [Sphaerochaetaceae bacterium]|nr:alpha/beta hydrolase [Sphaerochaetaceae bacterium]